MRRYRVEGVLSQMNIVSLTGDSFHHICDVCRQGVGSRFEVLTEDGYALFVEIESMDKKSATAQVLERRQIPPLKKPHIHLALSIPKIATMEAVMEKAVELGVHSIHPFFSDYSFVKTQKNVLENKMARFQKIIQSATQQTGRGDLMSFHSPVNLPEILKAYSASASCSGIFAYEGEGGKAIQSALKAAVQPLDAIWLFVGSEGGFSTQEVEIFKKINLFPVSLGQQVLRVETACVTLLGIIKYELDLF